MFVKIEGFMKHFIIILSIHIHIIFSPVYAQYLDPGDGVRINFYNISDAISGDFFVQQDGNLQLPYIGVILTNGRSYEDIKVEITTKYDSIYKEVELIVRPLYKINVLGEVQNPGIYYVTGVERLSDVIAMAGGETSDANISKVHFLRENKEIIVDIRDILEKGIQEKNILLKSGDRVYVPRKWWVTGRNVSFLISGATVIVALLALFIR